MLVPGEKDTVEYEVSYNELEKACNKFKMDEMTMTTKTRMGTILHYIIG